MIRPVDIQNKVFNKAVRGYREEEVDSFLDEIMADYSQLIEDLRHTQEENSRLVAELEKYRSSESTVLETLTTAKSLMADISASADKRADILLKNAELDAQLIKKEAQETAARLNEESEVLKARFIDFRTRYKKLLQQELQRFESLSGDLFPELGVDDFDDLPGHESDFIEDVSIPKVKSKRTPEPTRGTYAFTKGASAEEMQHTMKNIKF
ncbi:MAG: DivIVA domain-containing protein [Eubacterium sp.]|nr:DivIVA domain-containing protein [Candidatus Colimonas fimequi]